ncbi:MAG: hypothetical protein GY861_10820 [bacterium]|nr:hypothetical protein [bacterium]
MIKKLLTEYITNMFRDYFYDNVEVGGSFTFYEYIVDTKRIGDIYHVLAITEDTISYQKTWYGHKVGKPTTISKSEFKSLVRGGEYHGRDYLYSLS